MGTSVPGPDFTAGRELSGSHLGGVQKAILSSPTSLPVTTTSPSPHTLSAFGLFHRCAVTYTQKTAGGRDHLRERQEFTGDRALCRCLQGPVCSTVCSLRLCIFIPPLRHREVWQPAQGVQLVRAEPKVENHAVLGSGAPSFHHKATALNLSHYIIQ